MKDWQWQDNCFGYKCRGCGADGGMEYGYPFNDACRCRVKQIEQLKKVAQEIKDLRWRILCDTDDGDLKATSKPYWFLGMAALETAMAHFELAAIAHGKES